MEKKIGYAHRPLDREWKVLRYGLSSHSGCTRKESCPFPHSPRIKPGGLRWAAEYEIARRGGLTSSKRIEPQAVEGYLQALRERNSADIKKMVAEGNTGTGRSRRPLPTGHDLAKLEGDAREVSRDASITLENCHRQGITQELDEKVLTGGLRNFMIQCICRLLRRKRLANRPKRSKYRPRL